MGLNVHMAQNLTLEKKKRKCVVLESNGATMDTYFFNEKYGHV